MMHFYPSHYFWHIIQITLFLFYRDCMKLGEVDGKKIGCTVSLLVCFLYIFIIFCAILCHFMSVLFTLYLSVYTNWWSFL